MNDTENIDLTYVEGRTDTKIWAIGTILAALYGVGSLVPVSGFIAAGGFTASISLTLVIAPLFGILLGAEKGGIFGLIGGLLAMALGVFAPGGSLFILIPFLFLGPAISGFLTGLCVRPHIRGKEVPGAGITALYIAIIMSLYLIINAEAWWFMAYYATAFLVAIILQISKRTLDFERVRENKFWYLVPFAIVGTITDFSMMTMGAVYIFEIPAAVFGAFVFPIMLFERTIAVVVSIAIIYAVIRAFPEIWGSSDSDIIQDSQ